MSAPLEGVRVVEISAIGPTPFGTMLLGDLGADVIRVDRIEAARGRPAMEATNVGIARNRRSIAMDLKRSEGVTILLDLVDTGDVLIEGHRPGVVERLGFGPQVCLARNPRLVFARVSGWGQNGPLASTAGHDINYTALTGALHAIGRAGQPPVPPLNLVADFGGGGTFLALGVLAALLERAKSGQGQVIDVAMVDAVASLTAYIRGLMHIGMWTTQRASNLLDGGAPFYDCYECADGGFVAVGPVEPRFFAQFVERLGLDPIDFPQDDTAGWARQKTALAQMFRRRSRDEWAQAFAGSDACVTPVLTFDEAPEHPHLRARGTFMTVDGRQEPAPAPRFSRTPGGVTRGVPGHGEHTDEILEELRYDPVRIEALRVGGVVA